MYYAKKLWAAGSGGEVDLNFVPFVAPESFNDPSKYADYGCTVNLYEKFRAYKMIYPDADIAVEFTDAIAEVQIPAANSTIEVFETVLGVETSSLFTAGGLYTFTSDSTKRYMIRRVTNSPTFNFPIGCVWAYCCGVTVLGATQSTYLKYIFFYENILTSVYSFRYTTIEGVLTINGSIKNIPTTAFKGCTNLTKVITGDSVTTITGDNDSGVFMDCTSLEVADLGTDITSIGHDTFAYCTSLTSIICRAYNPPTLFANAFNGIPATTNFYVPNDRVAAYKDADGWVEFASRIYSINDL